MDITADREPVDKAMDIIEVESRTRTKKGVRHNTVETQLAALDGMNERMSDTCTYHGVILGKRQNRNGLGYR